MKKIFALALALFASTALAAVSSTKHNMNTFNGNTGDVCYYCHAAHNALSNAPLWSRNNSTASYTFYSSATISVNLAGTSNSVLDGVSNACLSCHDGTIGTATTIKGQIGTNNLLITNVNKKIGPVLTNDHPIGLTWNTNYAGLAASTAISPFKLYGTNQISCASCHSVHGGVATAAKQFMRADPASGTFCVTCHVNK